MPPNPIQLTTRQKLDATEGLFAPFPNLSTQGSYNYLNQTVRTDGYDIAAFDSAFKNRDPLMRLKLVPLLIHELQHFEDHLLSEWGSANLRRLFIAMNGRVSTDMSRLGELTAIHREVRDVHLNDYYTELYLGADAPWNGQQWRYEFSTGVKLDADGHERPDHPILFMKFSTHEDTPICRVPVTVAALLEVRAMAAEITTRIPLIGMLPDESDREMERIFYTNQLKELFYNPLMTKYTVIAHYFANLCHIDDILVALRGAARLAWIVLNLPDEYFDSIKIPVHFLHSWGDRNRAALKRRDRGYAYGVILANSKESSPDNVENAIDVILKQSGLPDASTILGSAALKRQRSYTDLPDGPYTDRFHDLAMFAELLGNPIDAIEGKTGYRKGLIPPIFTRDGKIFRAAGTCTKGTFGDPMDWIDRSLYIHHKFEEFLKACVV